MHWLVAQPHVMEGQVPVLLTVWFSSTVSLFHRVVQVLLWHHSQLCVSTPFSLCPLVWQLKVKLVEGAALKSESLLAVVLFCCVETCAVTCWVMQ